MPVFQGHTFLLTYWNSHVQGTEGSLQLIAIKTVVLNTTAHKKLNTAKSQSGCSPSPASDETAASTDTLIAALGHPNADPV